MELWGATFHFRIASIGRTTPDGEVLVLLHGSGVDETTLVPLAAEIAPRAVLVAVRGRIAQDGGMRWFTRITPTRFEQPSIRSETDAFASLRHRCSQGQPSRSARTIFLGYSNGANLISSLMLLHPGLVKRAVLLRAMPVLDDVPPADLSKAEVLVIAGAADATYAPFAPSLVALLRGHGAQVEARAVSAVTNSATTTPSPSGNGWRHRDDAVRKPCRRQVESCAPPLMRRRYG